MVFLTYDFVFFATVLIIFYYIIPFEIFRGIVIILSGAGFLYLYGGLTSCIVVAILLSVVYFSAKSASRISIFCGIATCVIFLITFKYTTFIISSIVGGLAPQYASWLGKIAKDALPVTAPLGISFFTFEFIHYLADVRSGQRPIERAADFVSFGLFWPTMVAGPIKRFEQFVPALHVGLAGPSLADLANGLSRVSIGLMKKWLADNLTGWIFYFEPQYSSSSISMKWVFVGAISARILLDFSGYSNIAIGFARILGIKVPENFNWPYFATSLSEFWQRWHISLSSWIRDYIYIPLGGNRLGTGRRILNGLTAMVLCGLWHGPNWNFAAWGVYHGVGLATGSLLGKRRRFLQPTARPPRLAILWHADRLFFWMLTLVFVGVGWLLFFYPVGTALTMARQLIGL